MSEGIFVALVDAYPTEADARSAPDAPDAPYLGVWTMPHPDAEPVHVFGPEAAIAMLKDYGWTREVTA